MSVFGVSPRVEKVVAMVVGILVEGFGERLAKELPLPICGSDSGSSFETHTGLFAANAFKTLFWFKIVKYVTIEEELRGGFYGLGLGDCEIRVSEEVSELKFGGSVNGRYFFYLVENQDKWQMSFVMPSKYGSVLPLPKDPSVRIKEVPRNAVAVVAFSVQSTIYTSRRNEIVLEVEKKEE
ncbi:hypothetical protein CRYUN_Cryun16bG0101700 [Craigia yunnanensis]